MPVVYVALKNISLILKSHHCRIKALKNLSLCHTFCDTGPWFFWMQRTFPFSHISNVTSKQYEGPVLTWIHTRTILKDVETRHCFILLWKHSNIVKCTTHPSLSKDGEHCINIMYIFDSFSNAYSNQCTARRPIVLICFHLNSKM